jgi:hypothetical protein
MLHVNRKNKIQITIGQLKSSGDNTISQISKFRRVLVTQKYGIYMLHTYMKGCSNMLKCFGLLSYVWL